MNISLRQLRYFVEIAQSKSYSRAAQHLNIAQSALSQNISALEEDLEVKLFTRHPRGIELSQAGEILLEKALDLIARTDALKEQLGGRDALPQGAVRLSIAGSLAGILVAPLLRETALAFPGIELSVREGLSSEVRAHVESGEAHLAAMPSPSELLGMASMTLFEERFMLFSASRTKQRKPTPIRFSDLALLPLAEPDGAHDLRKIIERAADAIGRPLDVRYELNSPAMLVSVVREGLAHSVMPPSACSDALAAGVITGQHIVEPELTRLQAVVWPRDRPLGGAAVAVRETLVKVVHQLLADGRLHGRIVCAEPDQLGLPSAETSHLKN